VEKNRVIKLFVGVMLGVVNILFSPECYSAEIPIKDTPLYKHIIETPKTTEQYSQKSTEPKIQQENPQKTTETKIEATAKSPKLTKRPGLSEIHSNMTFSEAINVYRNSTEPPLNIVVLWKDIEENTDVDKYTTIGIEPLSGISLGKNLELMLMAVSSDPKSLGYIVEKGVIIIAGRDSLHRKQETRVYDLTDLLGQPANYFTPPRAPMPYGGAYGGYGSSSYGMPNAGYGYGGNRTAGMYGGFGTQVGRIRTGAGLNSNPYNMSRPGYDRGRDIAGLIESHTFTRP